MMFKSYLKTAWRSLWHRKTTSVISLAGLALGVACFFLLGTYILNELRYDRFHQNGKRIVFASLHYQAPSDAEAVRTPLTPTALVPVAKRQFAAVESGTRVYAYHHATVAYGDRLFSEKHVWMADSAFFDLFSFPFLEGDPHTALRSPHSIVITQSMRRKYFGDAPALGKVLTIGKDPWQITGVIEDVPPYSSLQFDMMGSYVTLPRSKTESWSAANDLSFLLLRSPGQREAVEQGLNRYLREKFPEEFKSGYRFGFDLVPLEGMHLDSRVVPGAGSREYLSIFGGIAILLLLIACINFTNLVTAKSADRALEIGVRKVFGATRRTLFLQFMTESALITFFALVTGLLTAYIALPFFDRLTGLSLSTRTWNVFYLGGLFTGLFLAITFLAGAWPALVISRFRPASAIKSSHPAPRGSGRLRKFLVVFQFTVSVAFIIGTLVAERQMYFIQHTPTGLNRSQVVVLDDGKIQASQLDAFKAALLKNRAVKSVSASYDSPVDVGGGYTIQVAGQSDHDGLSVTAIPVDKDYVRTLGLGILRGADFTYTDELQCRNPDEDKRNYAFMLNEAAVKALGLTPDNAIGRQVNLNGRSGRIKAVLKDFNFTSLHQLIQPVVVFTEYDWFGRVLIKTSATDAAQALSAIKKTWHAFYPGKPFTYHFLDDEYNGLYQRDRRTAMLLRIFSLVTILISCLGLFGLAAFMSLQRTREIGIRKVLGASVTGILVLMSKDFMQLVALAVLIAAPLSWWIMDKWLQAFAYRIHIRWWMVAAGGLAALVITFATVGFQAIRAATANPVSSLRTE